jgi:hypothetical protein
MGFFCENHTNSEKKTSDPMKNPTRLKLWRGEDEIYGVLTVEGTRTGVNLAPLLAN